MSVGAISVPRYMFSSCIFYSQIVVSTRILSTPVFFFLFLQWCRRSLCSFISNGLLRWTFQKMAIRLSARATLETSLKIRPPTRSYLKKLEKMRFHATSTINWLENVIVRIIKNRVENEFCYQGQSLGKS